MSWYIAITNPNCQRRAENGLAAIGYRVFWPRLRKWVSHARTKQAKEYPVLGRYVFVEIPDAEFFAVSRVNGIEGLVKGFDGAPATIPPEIVWAFRDRYMAGEWDMVSKGKIPIGGLVRIMEGEFANLMTVVRGYKNGKVEFLPPGKREFYYTRAQNVRAA